MDERVDPAQSPTTTDPHGLEGGAAGSAAPGDPPGSDRPDVPGTPGSGVPQAPVDPSDPTAPAFDAAGDPVPARSFAPGIDDASLGFSSTVLVPPGCPWCGAPLAAADLATCPSCGAALQPVADLPEIPGVTVAPMDVRRTVRDVSPEIRALVTPPVTDEIAVPGSRPELGPPDQAVRRAMLELELQATRAQAEDAGADDAADDGSRPAGDSDPGGSDPQAG